MPDPNIYDVGDQVTSSIEFRQGAALADPTTITCKVEEPDGTETPYVYPTDPEVIKDAVGKYHLDITVNAEGTWTHRWEGTGAVVAAAEQRFVVRDSAFY